MRILAIVLAVSAILAAQVRVEFDAASIKHDTSALPGLMINTTSNGEFTAERVTLRNLIAFAYHLKEFQITGGPKWMDSEYYDVLAKPPHDADPPGASWETRNERNRTRLKNLLADRFQLAVHTESKEISVYALAVAKNGPHLDPAKGSGRQGINRQVGQIVCNGVSMKDFAEWALTPKLGNLVLDQTGLSGEFDFKLQFADDSPAKPGAPPPDRPADPSGPTLEMALQEQLGLKLETRKSPVPVIVVDRAEKASAN